MGKARPFLEVFTSFLNEDYGFPVLEIVAFIYTLGIFFVAPQLGPQHLALAGSEEAIVISVCQPLTTLFFVAPTFGLLILKNIAYSFGNDLERGVIQNLLSYPLKRRSLLTAKLLSSFGVVFMLLLGILLLRFFIFVSSSTLAPAVALLAGAAALSYPFLVASLVVPLTLFFKRGSIALFVGTFLNFFSLSFVPVLISIAGQTGSDTLLKITAIIFPSIAVDAYYALRAVDSPLTLLTPSFTEVLLYVGAGYALSILILTVGYLHFERKLEI